MAPDESGTCQYLLPAEPCPAGSTPRIGNADCQAVGPGECGLGFRPDGTGWGCAPILPAERCPTNAAPFLGESSCLEIGWSSCPPGFELAEPAAGCAPVAPEGDCAGATLATLGQTACAPVGDCQSPFPPADATLFVDDTFESQELDDHHFRTISDALTAASDSAIIAVESGQYAEALTAGRSLTIVGRCAAEVILQGSGSAPGLTASGAVAVAMSNVSLIGHQTGIQASNGAQLELQSVRLENNLERGLLVQGAGTEVQIDGVVVRGTLSDESGQLGRGVEVIDGASLVARSLTLVGSRDAGLAIDGEGSQATLHSALILRTDPAESGAGGAGITVDSGARLSLQHSLVAENTGFGISIAGVGSHVAVSETAILDTAARAGIGGGSGIYVAGGASAALERSALRRNHYSAIFVEGEGSQLTAVRSVVASTVVDTAANGAFGVLAQLSGRAVLDACIVEDEFIGLAADNAGIVETDRTLLRGGGRSAAGALTWTGSVWLRSTSLVDHPEVAAMAWGRGDLLLEDALVRGPSGRSSRAVLGVSLEDSGSATLRRTAIVGVQGYGLAVTRGSEATVEDSVLLDTRGSPQITGIGVMVSHGGRLDMAGSRVDGSYGVGLGCSESSALLERALIRGSHDTDAEQGMGVAAVCDVTIRDSAIVQHRFGGVMLGAGIHDLSGVLIDATLTATSGEFGHGFLAQDSEVTLNDLVVRGSAGVAMLFAGSAARVSSTLVEANAVGVHAQDGSELVELSEVPDSVGALKVVVASDVVFLANDLKVGTGTLPLPDILGSVN